VLLRLGKDFFLKSVNIFFYFLLPFFFWSMDVWTRGIHFEPIYQPFIMIFLKWGLLNYLPYWLWTTILLFSASWVARITDVSHWCLAWRYFSSSWKTLWASM
jgi:hypothetical protein